MSQEFPLQIISPTHMVFDAQTTLVEIPGVEGDFGVLKNHAPAISMLRPGVITVHVSNTGLKHYFVASGYAEISANGTVVLSDHVQELELVNVSDAKEALAAAEKAHAAAGDMDAKIKSRKNLEAAQALVTALRAA